MQIFCTNIKRYDLPFLENGLPGVLNSGAFSTVPLDKENASTISKETCTLVVSHLCTVDEPVLSQFPNLKQVVTRSTGINHVDFEYCREKNIAVQNIVDYSTESVAEYSVALLLTLIRNIHLQINSKNSRTLIPKSGFELRGKNVGIVGFGRIGENIAQLLAGFGVNIFFFNPSFKEAGVLRTQRLENLNELLGMCDVLFLCCPLNSQTKHLINQKNISILKPNAVLINTSRGEVVETKALIKALKENRIGGVALDVLEEESAVLSDVCHDLWSQFLNDQRVIFTPHNAFLSEESLQRLWGKVLDILVVSSAQEQKFAGETL